MSLKKILSILVSVFIFPISAGAVTNAVVNSVPVVSKLIYQCKQSVTINGVSKDIYGNCSWADLIAATKNAVNYITVLAIGFSVVVIAFIGFKILTSEGSPGALKEAKEMAQKVVIGMFFIICAWAIVTLIATGLGVSSFAFTP